MIVSLWPRIAALLCAGLLAFAATGCGGGDDNGGGSDFDDQPQAQQEDQKAVAAFVADFVKTARSGNAEKFCDLMAPDDREEVFGGDKECVTFFAPQLKRTKVRGSFEIENLEFDGDKAMVTFKGGQGEGELKKVDGEWYLQIPDQVVQLAEAGKN